MEANGTPHAEVAVRAVRPTGPRKSQLRPLPQPGELWQHWKGKLYRVICLTIDAETGAEAVTYCAADSKPPCYSRPLWRWQQTVTVAEGDRRPRFVRVEAATQDGT